MMKKSLAVLALSIAAPLLAYDTNLAWVYDASSRPAEAVVTGTGASASGVDARAVVYAEPESPLAEMEARPWFAVGFATWLELTPFGLGLMFK